MGRERRRASRIQHAGRVQIHAGTAERGRLECDIEGKIGSGAISNANAPVLGTPVSLAKIAIRGAAVSAQGVGIVVGVIVGKADERQVLPLVADNVAGRSGGAWIRESA